LVAVDLSRGFNLSPSVQARLRILDWIADNGGTVPGRIIQLGPLFEGQDEGAGQTIGGYLDSLAADGLVQLQNTLDLESLSCDVTSKGVELIEDLRQRRGDLMGRQKVARDAFLYWLYDAKLGGSDSPDTEAFDRSDFSSYYGSTFTQAEVNAAGEWLRDEGHLTALNVAAAGVVRPTITTKGQKVVERGASVNDDSPAAANMPVNVNFTNSGSYNQIALNSPGATQSMTVTITEDRSECLTKLASAVDEYAPHLGLNPGQAAEAQTVALALREVAAEPVADSGRLKGLIDTVKVIAIGGTGGAFGDGLVALAQQTAEALFN
jgi:hypothetical protein